MRCFYYDRCGERNLVAPVLLMCDCLVGICQECAKKELLIMFSAERHKKKVLPDNGVSENKYEAYLCCPKCKAAVSSRKHNIIKGVENALEAEERLLLAAMTDAGISYYKHTTDLAELQRCWDKLNEDCAKPIKTEPNVLSDNSSTIEEAEPVQVARLRKKIAALAYEHNPHYDNPLDMLSFTTNSILSRIQEQPPSQNSSSTGMEHSHHEGVSGITECIVCTNTLQSGCSVQLTCSCSHIMCRNCALINIHYRPETYHQGVSCPQCRTLSPGVLQNTHTVREIEDLLLQSARHYATNRFLTFREKSVPENERQNCIQMIKLYHAIGYDGNINVLNEKERDSASLARLKLEVAKLEEFRLNSAGLIDSYGIHCDMNNVDSARKNKNTDTTAASINSTADSVTYSHDNDHTKAGKFPVSFMHALKVCKNTFFEHYYLHNQTSTAEACIVAAKLAECQAQCASLITKLQELMYAHSNHKLDLLDKLVFVCMKIHTTSITDSPTPTTADSSDTTDTTSNASTTTDSSSSHTGCTINQLVIIIWNFLKHPELQFHKYFNSANNKSEFMSVVYKRVTPQAVQASVKKLVLNNVVNLVIKDVTLYQDERYVLSDNDLKSAQLEPHLIESLSPRYYTDYSLLTPCNTSSSVPASVTGATSATSLHSTSLSRVIPATNTNDGERASPTVYKVYSARAVLIDPNRPVKKKKTSSLNTSSTSNSSSTSSNPSNNTSNNQDNITTDATSSSSGTTTAAVLPLTTMSLPVNTESSTTIPSVLKKRGPGRPSLVDKDIDLSSADRSSGAAANSNSGKAYTGNNPEGKQFIFVIDPATGKKCRKYLDSFDVPTTAKTSSKLTVIGGDRTSATSQASISVGYKRCTESESESELVDTSDDEACTKPKRKLQKVRSTSSSTGVSTSLNILQKEATDSKDTDIRMENSDVNMDGGNGSDGGGGSQSDPDDNYCEHDSNHSDSDCNINSDEESDSEHSSTHSTCATHTTKEQQHKQTQLQEMINSLKHAANEAFKDAARVREENKLLRTELASMRNTNVFTLPAQKIEIEKFKARTAELKEQLKTEQSHRQILEQEKNAAEAARAAEKAILDAKIASLQQQQRILHEECEQYKTNLKNSDNELKVTRAEIDKLTTQVEKLKNANFRFKKEKEDAEKALESARKSHLNALTAKDKTIKQLQDDVKKVQDSTKGSGDSYLNYTVALNKLNEKKSELQGLQKQYDQLAVVNGNHETELRNLKRELNEVKDRNGQQREEIKELAVEVDNLKKMKHRRESEEKQAQEEIQDLFASIQS